MTLQFYRISFCVLYRVGALEGLSLEGPCVSMSGISVKNSWANCSPGHRLHITVKHRPTVVKMKGREGGKDHIIQIQQRQLSPAVSPHLTFYISFYSLC